MVTLTAGCFVLGLVAGFVFGRNRWWGYARLALALLAAIIAFCLFVPKSGQGFEDIGYMIVAKLICLPDVLGTVSGLLLGWIRARAVERAA